MCAFGCAAGCFLGEVVADLALCHAFEGVFFADQFANDFAFLFDGLHEEERCVRSLYGCCDQGGEGLSLVGKALEEQLRRGEE